MTGQERGLRIAVLVFFLSGAASLADELIWFKYLSFTFGATTAAAATLVAVFMGGLALGSWLCGRLVSRIARPDLLYAVLETGVAVLALATPVFFSWIGHAYVAAYRHFGDGPGKLMLIRVLLSAVALLPPTVLMGATFPALARAVEGISRPGRRSTLLYGVNTAGAVVGVLACGFVLIPSIGLHATLVGSACVSLLGALLAAFSGFARPAPVVAERLSPKALWLLVAFVTGACAMADEVLWTRILVLHLGSSVYAFALMLATFLIGLVGGSLIGAALRSEDLRRSIGVAQLSFGFSILLQVFAFTGYSRTLVAVATSLLHVRTYGGVLLAEAVTTGLFLLPPTLLMGLSFALLLQAASRSAGTAPADVASVYSANTLGGIGGSLLAGFAAIPLIGSQSSLLATGFLATCLALLLSPKSWLMRLAPAGFLLLCLLPARDAVIRSAGVLSDVPAQDVIFLREDVTATVAVKRLGGARPSLSLELNGVNVAGSTPDNVVIQKLQAHLPLALCEDPEEDPAHRPRVWRHRLLGLAPSGLRDPDRRDLARGRAGRGSVLSGRQSRRPLRPARAPDDQRRAQLRPGEPGSLRRDPVRFDSPALRRQRLPLHRGLLPPLRAPVEAGRRHLDVAADVFAAARGLPVDHPGVPGRVSQRQHLVSVLDRERVHDRAGDGGEDRSPRGPGATRWPPRPWPKTSRGSARPGLPTCSRTC